MPGITPVFKTGSPLTFAATTLANGGNIKGGQLVEPDGTTGRIKPATAGSTKCLGVAMNDMAASDYLHADSADPWGNSIADMNAFPPNEGAVSSNGVFRLKAAGTIGFGDLVQCAANGEVVTIGAGAFATVVGRCVEPGGIASGARGKILLGGIGGA